MHTTGRLLSAVIVVASVSAIGAEKKIISFPAATDTPARITLLQRAGEIGRDNAFYDNYRPQVRFSADRREVTCAVRIPKPREKVDPGETAEVALNCADPFRSFEDEKAFVVFEGGRKVAEGRLN
jgi:translation elongation factor EF-Tu-like GTPase